jgi:hypothetical protein
MISKTTRRNALAALPAVAVMAPAVATAAVLAPDPIFAAIEAHRAAFDAWKAWHDVAGDPATNEARIEAGRRENKALHQVFAVAPATPAGVAALLAWLAEPEFGEEPCTSRITVIGDFDCDDAIHVDLVRQLQAAAAVLREARP